MRVLCFGAGPLGSLYANLLHENDVDVTVLARGERHDWIRDNGLILHNEMTGQRDISRVRLINELRPEDKYDLAIILIRKNKLGPVLETLADAPGIGQVLFMGNNALGFDTYLKRLPASKLLFGFPGAGGGIRDQVVHYADRESPRGKRNAITLGEIDGHTRDRTLAIKSVFESAGIPVDLTEDIDGWLKYHVALVSPLVAALYKHDCVPGQVANDKETLRQLVQAAMEGGRVLRALGYRKRQPFSFNLFYWLPEFMSRMALKEMLQSRFAEIAFAMHALAARDEMIDMASEFQQLIERTSIETPNIDALREYIGHESGHP